MTKPLAGIKVVDFAGHGFVPSAAAALSDWGAEVVKIERPGGDPMRAVIRDGLVPDADGTDYLWEFFNRNKRGIAFDIETAAGREIFERLVKWADVYITNQLPRGPQEAAHRTSRPVRARTRGSCSPRDTGRAERGPDAEAGGFDSVSYWSRGGVGHMLSSPDAASPVGQRAGQGDIPSGMFLAAGVCAALVSVARTGEGVVVDTSLLGAAMWTLAPDLAYTSIAGHEPPRTRADPTARSPLVGAHRTADGRWLQLSMLDEDRYWAPTCRALGLWDLVEQFPDQATRTATGHTSTGGSRPPSATAPTRLSTPRCVPRDASSRSTRHPTRCSPTKRRPPTRTPVPHPTHPTLRLSAAPAQFDDELPTIRRPAPTMGEHTREILTELGYAPDEITRFVDGGVVVTE